MVKQEKPMVCTDLDDVLLYSISVPYCNAMELCDDNCDAWLASRTSSFLWFQWEDHSQAPSA